MDIVQNAIMWVIDTGAFVMLPILLIVVGLICGQRFSVVFKGAILFGIGLIGLNLVIGLMIDSITPIVEGLVDAYGLDNSIVDIGWSSGALIAWGTDVVPIVFISILLTNLIMLIFGWTKTFNIDIWNYWHALFIGSAIVLIGGGSTLSYVLAAVSASINMIIVFKIADWIQPDCEEVLGLKGITFPHIQGVGFALIDYPINWLLDKIPFVNKIKWTCEKMQAKLGVFGEPMVEGFIIGAILAIFAQMNISLILKTAISAAGILMILPKMISLLMEGLMVFSKGINQFVQRRFPNREIYIGLNAAIAIGHPMIILLALILIPITSILAFVLPGVAVLPISDLTLLALFNICAILPHKGNLFRAIIIGTINSCILLYIATYAAPIMTTLIAGIDTNLLESSKQVTSLAVGAQWYTWIPFWISKIIMGV